MPSKYNISIAVNARDKHQSGIVDFRKRRGSVDIVRSWPGDP